MSALKRYFISFFIVILFSLQAQAATPTSFAPLAKKLLPAVVNISTTQEAKQAPSTRPELPSPFPPGSPFEDFFEEFFNGPYQGMPQKKTPLKKAKSLGSGFIIDPSGLIVTNNHVIAHAEEIEVTLHDDRTFKAKILGIDSKTDVALLKVETEEPLPFVPWGDSDVMEVGDWVVVVGNPFGLGGTVTSGIISARARDINAGPYDDFIQTDASINRGNSGGPMFNMKGEVIGISTAIFSPTGGSVGIGFAVPSNMAKSVTQQIVKYGRTRRGWLGVRIQPMSKEIARNLGLKKIHGALVASVTDQSPAQKGGVIAGDVIIEFDGKEIRNTKELPRIVAETDINKKVPIVVWRNNKNVKLFAKLGELEVAEENHLITSKGTKKDDNKLPKLILGLGVSPITPALKQRFKVPDNIKGIIITKIMNGDRSSEVGLRVGDIILMMNQKQVHSVQDFTKRISKVHKSGEKSVLLWVYRNGEKTFIALPLDRK